MKARLGPNVRLRADEFGGVCYVPHRDDFFAADDRVFGFLKSLDTRWRQVPAVDVEAVKALARLGICETESPKVLEQAYSGPSFLGNFAELPTVSKPLVVNCFCTAHCPLRCVYCHADDLMQQFREGESDVDLQNVAATASEVPAMVAVITGGDPLTRPERAKFLIERLAASKALVLDTSGVGDVDALMPTLKEHSVHVRISLDAISDLNRKLRPANKAYGVTGDASRQRATQLIERCIREGVAVTVQTVVCSLNESMDEWRDLRDWLIGKRVRNWVLHVAVKGGSARRIEDAAIQHSRKRGILPSDEVYERLWSLVEETQKGMLPIDIRCTDTGNTPNSVLLVGSKGDLYTEGYAHNGKVALYRVEEARPDKLQALWPHLDRFGHARRYLNWNPWFFNGESLNKICYEVPIVGQVIEASNPIETEAKYVVRDLKKLQRALKTLGYLPVSGVKWQRDEYYDTQDKITARMDYVVRLRKEIGYLAVALKGPRYYAGKEYSRIELEFPAGPEASVRETLARTGFEVNWFFEKKRRTYRHSRERLIIAIDEVPEIGYFVEIEGPLPQVRGMERKLSDCLGEQETRNYMEVFRRFKASQGLAGEEILGAGFDK